VSADEDVTALTGWFSTASLMDRSQLRRIEVDILDPVERFI